MTVVAWVWYGIVQLIMLSAAAAGLVILIPFCLAQAWRRDPLPDEWRWGPLNYVYGNPEDGVSGQHARVWNHEGTARVPYMPVAWAPWRAYCWSALRNSSNNLKYVFAWKSGPLKQFKLFGKTVKIGWQGGLPVL